MIKPRQQARQLALEVLFEYDLAAHDAFETFQRRVQEQVANQTEKKPMNAVTVEFSHSLLTGVVEAKVRLDALITAYAPEWPVDQIAAIDRNILRLALYEILISQKTPLKVAINEAVELAKMYGSDSTPRFVNGVLGAVVAEEVIVAPTDGD